MSVVIEHPKAWEARVRQMERETDPDRVAARQRDAFLRDRERATKLAHARREYEKRPLIHRDEERRTIGRNMWSLLDEIERGPARITKASVLEEARKTESTKHLSRYALRPESDPEKLSRRARDLSKRVVSYLQIAHAAAAKAGLNKDEVELRVLEGTSYLQDVPEDPRDEDRERRARELEQMLLDIVRRVADVHGLAPLMRRMDEGNLVLREGNREAPMVVSAAECAPSEVLSSGDEVCADWDWLARYPTLHLGYAGAARSSRGGSGYVVGEVCFTRHDGTRHTVSLQPLLVDFVEGARVDLVVGPTSSGRGVRPVIAITHTCWVKPSEPIVIHDAHGEALLTITADHTLAQCSHLDSPHLPDWVGGFGRQLSQERIPMAAGAVEANLILLCDDDGFPCRPGELSDPSWITDFAMKSRPEPSAWCYRLGSGQAERTLNLPRQFRHFPSDPRASGYWTDERAGGTTPAEHPLRDLDALGTELLEPVDAPHGSLHAFIRRWMAGQLKGAGRLEEALHAEAVAFVQRMRATDAKAREALLRAVYPDGEEGE